MPALTVSHIIMISDYTLSASLVQGDKYIWGQSKNTAILAGGIGLLLSIFTLTPNVKSTEDTT